MPKRITVSVWLVIAAAVFGGFLFFQVYLRPCQATFLGQCDTYYFDDCCPGRHLFCSAHICWRLNPDTKTYEDK